VDFTALATKLVTACTEQDLISIAEVLVYLDLERVDVFVYIHTPSAHLSIVGSYRSLYLPEDPHAIQREPGMEQIARVLAEVGR
ncbi:MAG TPA: hypothetical protein VFA32_07000, partial [Dehalococcoidia bacterium]|nr:hypothetical protein [Dehalococcoidia bacterium]